MILHTIINGQTVEGSTEKKIVHPFTGLSPDAVSYARGLQIPAFRALEDREVFRAALVDAAQAIDRFLQDNKDATAATAAAETGSPLSYQYHDIEGARAFLQQLDTLGSILPTGYRFEPKGNILLILSANEPIITSTILVFSGLFMGNAVFVKPSSKTPSYSRMLVEELAAMPVVRERVHYLLSDSAETERLIRSKAFDFVFAFGSRPTNKQLGIMCAESEVEFLPESEGNDWAYVDASCTSLDALSKTVVESFLRHNGQMCNALRGVLVHASRYDEFVPLLKAAFTGAVGSPDSAETRVGALIIGTRPYAQQLADDAAAKAKDSWHIAPEGDAFGPMIIIEPDDEAAIFSESIFAPVLWVKKVADHEQAISWFAQKNRHGLGFSVFSQDDAVIDACIRRIPVGRMNINRAPLDIGLFDPLGGIRLSGRGGPSHWIEKMSNRLYLNK
jgi:acyl-CoA reductase-like NAD-dependent aldehyde dehydrogenase